MIAITAQRQIEIEAQIRIACFSKCLHASDAKTRFAVPVCKGVPKVVGNANLYDLSGCKAGSAVNTVLNMSNILK
jgi:hypothetical protein